MNVDRILRSFNQREVAYLLVGGMNFLLRHAPVLTFDVDLWIDDTPENRGRCERALSELDAEWGATDDDWRPVADLPPGWLARQAVFCLTSPHGPIDVFRSVEGLGSWAASRAKAHTGQTGTGVAWVGLSDEDMLACQLALPEGQRKLSRIEALEKAIRRGNDDRSQS